jgi:hypothetical protein
MRAWLAGFGSLVAFGMADTASAALLELSLVASSPTSEDRADVESPGPGPLVDQAQLMTPALGEAQALGTADFGLLRNLSGAASQEPGGGGSQLWGAGANVSWDDSFTIAPANPALLGTVGTFVSVISVSGSGGVGEAAPSDFWAGSASWQATITFSPLTQPTVQSALFGQWTGNSLVAPSYTGDPLVGQVVSNVSFVFGEPVRTTALLQTTASAEIGTFGRSESFADFQSTLVHLGFQEVRDGQGSLLAPAEYTVGSDSETDWSEPHPVPEADAPELAVALLAGIGGLRRLRTQRSLRPRRRPLAAARPRAPISRRGARAPGTRGGCAAPRSRSSGRARRRRA